MKMNSLEKMRKAEKYENFGEEREDYNYSDEKTPSKIKEKYREFYDDIKMPSEHKKEDW